MNFTFDNDRPIYTQLAHQIKVLIVSGNIEPGEKLPSVRDFALKCKVNPNTMQKALTALEEEKLIFTERTNGKYATNDIKLIEKIKKELANEKVQIYLAEMKNLGFTKEDAINYLHEKGGKN